MSIWKELLVICFTSCFISVIVFYEPRPKQLFHWCLKGLLVFGIIAFIIHQLDKVWQKVKCFLIRKRESKKTTPVEAVKSKQREQLTDKQNQYSQQAEEYSENVLKPREEARSKQREDEFYRFAGPAWKGQGQKLGVPEGSDESSTVSFRKRGSGKDAAEARKLPDHVTNPEIVQQQVKAVVKPKIKIELPAEPEAGVGVVALSFRTMHRIHRRRFSVHDKIKVVLDYITSLGYHQKHYSLCASYPRQCLSDDPEKSLQEVGVMSSCVLNVEEKE